MHVIIMLASGDFWASGLYKNGNYVPDCPFNYCIEDAVKFTLDNPDNRSDIICGQCKFNYSLNLDGSGCSTCSSKHLVTFGFLFLFALLGLALVALLILLKLTIVFGTLNGMLTLLV